MRRTRLNFILTVQLILFLGHGIVFATWISLAGPTVPGSISKLAIVFALLSVSFVSASSLAFRYYNFFVGFFYTVAAAWLGILNFLFLGSLASWIVYGLVRAAHVPWPSRNIVATIFALSVFTGLCGIANAFWLRVRRIDVTLPNLPDAWRGRTAALISDTHLGPVRGAGFTEKLVTLLNGLKPDVVFITGDFYDGTAADVTGFAAPFKKLFAPFGAFFVTGNHEEFTNVRQYIEALSQAGVRVLQNETVDLEGLQIVGIPYHEMRTPEHIRATLQTTSVNPAKPSILLIHAPNRLYEAEHAGISFQLSGHTHKGQFFPWTLFVKRIYRQFGYGLQRLGNMQVYTTSGAGTWGPPVRLGAAPEVVLFSFVSGLHGDHRSARETMEDERHEFQIPKDEAEYLVQIVPRDESLGSLLESRKSWLHDKMTVRLTRAEAMEMGDFLTIELARRGFDENDKPNAEGLMLENLIDRFFIP